MRQDTGASRPETESERELRLWPRAPRIRPFRFRQAPLLVAAICFALGASLTKLPLRPAGPALLIVSVACLLSATAISLRRAWKLELVPACLLWILVGFWSARIEPAPAPQTALLAYADGLSRNVEGRVLRVRELPTRHQEHEQTSDSDWDGWDEQSGTPTLSVDIGVTDIEDVTPDSSRMVPIAGGVRTTLLGDGAAAHLRCGDMVQMPMRLRIPERYRDPGAWQYVDYLLEQGIAVTASVPAAKLGRAPDAGKPPLRQALQCRLFPRRAGPREACWRTEHRPRTAVCPHCCG